MAIGPLFALPVPCAAAPRPPHPQATYFSILGHTDFTRPDRLLQLLGMSESSRSDWVVAKSARQELVELLADNTSSPRMEIVVELARERWPPASG